MKIHGEIEYQNEGDNVHSDLLDSDINKMTEDDRQLLHTALDEWLEKSSGTGCFYVASYEWLDRGKQ